MNPIESLQRFHNDTVSILALRAYLYSVEAEVYRGNANITKTHAKVMEKIGEGYKNPHDYMMSRMFLTYIADFESLIQDLSRFVLRKYPKRLGSKTFTLNEILDAENNQYLIEHSIDEYLNKLMYKKPLEYLNDISDLLGFNKNKIIDKWKIFIEAKARRDLGIHNQWICNQIYIRKLNEANISPILKVGENSLPVDEQYLTATSDAIYDLAQEIVDLTIAKHGL